jgi:hypothetical protein
MVEAIEPVAAAADHHFAPPIAVEIRGAERQGVAAQRLPRKERAVPLATLDLLSGGDQQLRLPVAVEVKGGEASRAEGDSSRPPESTIAGWASPTGSRWISARAGTKHTSKAACGS